MLDICVKVSLQNQKNNETSKNTQIFQIMKTLEYFCILIARMYNINNIIIGVCRHILF